MTQLSGFWDVVQRVGGAIFGPSGSPPVGVPYPQGTTTYIPARTGMDTNMILTLAAGGVLLWFLLKKK